MVRTKRKRGWLLAALVGGTCGGCVSPHSLPDVTALPAAARAEGAPADELPPRQAAEACLATGKALEQNGHEAEAAAEYERARQLGSASPLIGRRLAVLYDRLGEDARSLAEYEQTLKHQPRDADLLNDLGYFHYARGHWPEAERCLRQALEINPKLARAWVNLGLTLVKSGQTEAGLEAFGKALPPAEATYNVGVLLAQQGRVEEARALLQRSLSLDPNLGQARQVLAKLEGGAAKSGG
jgi:Tfp pilus assembly protein PilF